MPETTTYDCLTCEPNIHFDTRPEMIEHIKAKHGFISGAKATRIPKMFADGQGWHSQVHVWDFGTYKIQENWESHNK